MTKLTKIGLSLALFCTSFPVTAQSAAVPNIVAATQTYMKEGGNRVETLVEAIAEDGDFHQNLQTVLTTIVESDTSDAVKVSRLKDLEAHVKKFAHEHNESIHSLAKTLMWAGAVIGAVAYVIFGPSASGHDQIDFLIIPAMNAVGNAVAGGSVGALVGAVIGIPWQLSSRRNLIEDRSIDIVRTTCDSLLAKHAGSPEGSI